MKLIVLLALLVASTSAGKGGKFMEIVKDCCKENKLQLAEVVAAVKGSGTVTTPMGCMTTCVGSKMQIMNSDGTLNSAVATAMSEKSPKYGAFLKACGSKITGGDKCARGKSLLECVISKLKQGGGDE